MDAKGKKRSKQSFVKLGSVRRTSNRYGQYLKDGKTLFSQAKLKSGDASRVYMPAIVLGYKRSLKRQHPNRTLVEIIGVKTKEDARFYLGKRVLYVYKAPGKGEDNTDKVRTLIGKVTRTHGNTGVVQVNFQTNISPTSFGKRCRVLLYPCNN